ncbi:hypothetical protein Ctob_007288 [Chrysochromulina tobinii]|uniref:Uncharacterized protein n=1 Tax=Chrysochromulina tobinii TaxID=1460289 RepID=A0A0M0JUD1_9EUKA|nr:hypothetical protein Ctob_007288 [Chrysochromulina tobinii]|eukprot:KOO30296.1 hypothetical protein Ctob_007288 [Chrysochromulina sp. CCMP291]
MGRLRGHLVNEPRAIMLVGSGVDAFDRVTTLILLCGAEPIGRDRLHRAPCLHQRPESGCGGPVEENEDVRGQVKVGDGGEHQLELGLLHDCPIVPLGHRRVIKPDPLDIFWVRFQIRLDGLELLAVNIRLGRHFPPMAHKEDVRHDATTTKRGFAERGCEGYFHLR